MWAEGSLQTSEVFGLLEAGGQGGGPIKKLRLMGGTKKSLKRGRWSHCGGDERLSLGRWVREELSRGQKKGLLSFGWVRWCRKDADTGKILRRQSEGPGPWQGESLREQKLRFWVLTWHEKVWGCCWNGDHRKGRSLGCYMMVTFFDILCWRYFELDLPLRYPSRDVDWTYLVSIYQSISLSCIYAWELTVYARLPIQAQGGQHKERTVNTERMRFPGRGEG